MSKTPLSELLGLAPFFSPNWETNIHGVRVEMCDKDEDPLGYRAVFSLGEIDGKHGTATSFAVGASFLVQRKFNLGKAGYKAPMTQRAISAVERRIGRTLPMYHARDMEAA